MSYRISQYFVTEDFEKEKNNIATKGYKEIEDQILMLQKNLAKRFEVKKFINKQESLLFIHKMADNQKEN